MSEPARSDIRITELEIQLAHVQRLYEQLNSVVTEQAMRADRLERKIASLQRQLSDVKEKHAEPPSDPLDEKPPHY